VEFAGSTKEVAPMNRRLRASAGISARKDSSASRFGTDIVRTIRNGAGRDLDKRAVADGEEGVGQGQEKMGRLPEALEQTES
jgi:hypothetical protein